MMSLCTKKMKVKDAVTSSYSGDNNCSKCNVILETCIPGE